MLFFLQKKKKKMDNTEFFPGYIECPYDTCYKSIFSRCPILSYYEIITSLWWFIQNFELNQILSTLEGYYSYCCAGPDNYDNICRFIIINLNIFPIVFVGIFTVVCMYQGVLVCIEELDDVKKFIKKKN